MAGLVSLGQGVSTLRVRTKEQADGLDGLAEALARQAESLKRRDQAERIIALRARVVQEVESITMAEDGASSHFMRRNRRKASAHHVASIALALLSRDDRRFQDQARLAGIELSKTAPFSTVMVKIDPSGIPEGAEAISLSRLAREGCTSESEMKNRLEALGHRLMTPESFLAAIDALRDKILEGKVSLPVTDLLLIVR